MPPSDLDITRTAHLWIQEHGDDATVTRVGTVILSQRQA
jgi:hypothetical protein